MIMSTVTNTESAAEDTAMTMSMTMSTGNAAEDTAMSMTMSAGNAAEDTAMTMNTITNTEAAAGDADTVTDRADAAAPGDIKITEKMYRSV